MTRARWSCLLALVALLSLGAAPAWAVTNTFNGSTDSNWNVATNWSQGHAPTAAEDVVLNAAVTLSSGADGVAKSIAVNTSTGLTVATGKKLTVGTGSSSIAATVTLTDGAVLTLGGATTWSGGNIGFGGTSVASLENNGVLTVTGASPMALHTVCCSEGLIHNNAGATIDRSPVRARSSSTFRSTTTARSRSVPARSRPGSRRRTRAGARSRSPRGLSSRSTRRSRSSPAPRSAVPGRCG